MRRMRSGDIAGLLILIIIGALFLTSFVSGRPGSGAAAGRTKCLNNIRNVTLALLNYHQDHGSFPPAYVADQNGRPLYSWRVLLLQYLDRPDLHRKFHYDEPWDSPHNRTVTDQVIEVFRCPADDGDQTCTSYLAVVGPNMAWKGSEPTRLSDITDDHTRTILLVEAADTGIHWAEPRDLHINQIPLRINPKNETGISSHHAGSVIISLVGGSSRTIGADTPPETLRRLLEINDGGTIDDF